MFRSTDLTPCNGYCSTVDKTTLKFFEIEEIGLIDGATPPGKWATDDLTAAGGQWTVKNSFYHRCR
jgi:hypothetical protein